MNFSALTLVCLLWVLAQMGPESLLIEDFMSPFHFNTTLGLNRITQTSSKREWSSKYGDVCGSFMSDGRRTSSPQDDSFCPVLPFLVCCPQEAKMEVNGEIT